MVPEESDGGWTNWPAPAKLNLMLHVVGRRPDGYHDLQTVFQLLDWGDEVRLRPRADGRLVRLQGPVGVAPEEDLVFRAADRLRRAAGVDRGADIAVDKQIPMGGGFGGGSSDAATVLRGLDLLWGLGLGEDALARIGLELGADVPMFVRGHSAWAEGVGDRLTPLSLPESWFVLLDPGVHVPTGALFQAPDLTRDAAPVTMADFVSGRCTDNAFQVPVAARHPRVAAALEALSRFGSPRLTGSGSGCFIALESGDEARRAESLLAAGWLVRVARGINRSPLLDVLDATATRFTGASPSG